MAKALQCPDCGNRHPLADVAHLGTFRCHECRRLLKVPASVAVSEAKVPAGRVTPGETEPRPEKPVEADDATEAVRGNGAAATTRVPPSQRGDVVVERTRALDLPRVGRRSPVPLLVRALVWVVAIPVGLLPIVVGGRATGLLTMERAVDLFVGVGWGRFLPPLLVIPVWAAFSATVAHVAIEALARVVRPGPGTADPDDSSWTSD